MVRVNVLRDALKTMVNAERKGEREVLLSPCSRVLIRFLRQMQSFGYIGKFEIVDDQKNGKIIVELLGRITKASIISPRFSISKDELVETASRLLPSRQFGQLILTTNRGIMNHTAAQNAKIGGKILGYFF